MEKGNALTQLNAASALLQLTCDAVVELDDKLCLAVPKLGPRYTLCYFAVCSSRA